MNATAFIRGIAMLGKPRAKQTVHRVSSRYGGYSIFGDRPPNRHVVLVTPHGAERGEYYEVSDAGLHCLEDGMTPADLDLDPHVPDDAEEDEYEESFSLRRQVGMTP